MRHTAIEDVTGTKRTAARRTADETAKHPEQDRCFTPEIEESNHPIRGGDEIETPATLKLDKTDRDIFTMPSNEATKDGDHPDLTEQGHHHLMAVSIQAGHEANLKMDADTCITVQPHEKGYVSVSYITKHEPEPDAATLQELAQAHLPILRQATRNTGFRHQMPAGGLAAINAGLVAEADPTWMLSDDTRASNGFELTQLGRQVAQSLGWNCRCSGCREELARMGRNPAVAIDGFCGSCQGSIRQYGLTQFRDEPCCRYHRRQMEYDGTAERFLTAADVQLAEMAQEHAGAIKAAINQTEFERIDEPAQAAIKAGFVTLRPTGLTGLDQDPLWLKLTPEGEKAAAAMGMHCQCGGCAKQRKQTGTPPAPATGERCHRCVDTLPDGSCANHREKNVPKWKWYKQQRLGWVACADATNLTPLDEPKPGDVITVMRRWGGTSKHTITEVRHTDHHINPPMLVAILEGSKATHDAMTATDAEPALKAEPVRYVKPDRIPEKSWVTPTAAEKPITWSWRQRANQWVATGSRPLCQDEAPPQPGELITVRRRDRSESRQRTLSYCGMTRDGFPQITVTPA